LIAYRKEMRDQRVQGLAKLWDRLEVPTDARSLILDQVGQPTKIAFDVLEAVEMTLREELVEPMKVVQVRLLAASSDLNLPVSGEASHFLNTYLRDESALPTIEMLADCELQAAKLEGIVEVVAPLFSGVGPEQSRLMGEMAARMLEQQARMEALSADEMKAEGDRRVAEAERNAERDKDEHERKRRAAKESKQVAVAAQRAEREEQRRFRAQAQAAEAELEALRRQLDAEQQVQEERALRLRVSTGHSMRLAVEEKKLTDAAEALAELEKREETLKEEVRALQARGEAEKKELETAKIELETAIREQHDAATSEALELKQAMESQREEMQAQMVSQREEMKMAMDEEARAMEAVLEEETKAMEEKTQKMQATLEAERQSHQAALEEQRTSAHKTLENAKNQSNLLLKINSKVAEVSKSILLDRKALEERQQAEFERQALEKEGGVRREQYAALNLTKVEKIRQVNAQLKMLEMSDRVKETFNEKYQTVLPKPGAPPPMPEEILAIQMQIDELGAISKKLQMRCESDGLFVALRNLCAANVWKPKDLARQAVSGPSSLKDAKGADPDSITKEQLIFWLEKKNIQHTVGSLSFFYSAVGSSKKAKMTANAFIKAFDTVKSHPVEVV